MPGPLEGIRIIEIAGIGPAPFAAMLLADMGAEIIRVDRPGGADPWTRDIIPRGRKSVIANLKQPDDVKAVAALIARADALIEGFRPGVMERLGLGPEAMHRANPRLVYARMTGWGQSGPLAETAGHDITYLAITGALHAIGPAERPIPPLNLAGDLGGGAMYLVSGILAALLSASRGGKGQVIDCAISDCTAHLMAMQYDLAAQGRWTDQRESNLLDGAAPFYRCYPCSDGKFLAVGCLERPFFETFARLIGLSPVPSEAARHDPACWPALTGEIASILATRSRDDWAQLMGTSDACIAPVLSMAEAPFHPHNIARKTFGPAGPAPQPGFSQTVLGTPTLLTHFRTLAEAGGHWNSEESEDVGKNGRKTSMN